MLKIENLDIYGWEAATRGMRNPMNSWEKSDSLWFEDPDKFILGDADLKLMKSLAKGGPVHAKYRRMINVTMDITAPLYWWKEYDTYKVGTVCNSCSTMHKIQAKDFTLEDFSCEHLIDTFDELCRENGDIETDINLTCIDVDGHSCYYTPKGLLSNICQCLNHYRKLYLETNDKKYWWQMIQLLPSSYNQKRTIQLNYEVLSHIYFDRKDHKLNEWHTFCNMIRTLPHAKHIITMED